MSWTHRERRGWDGEQAYTRALSGSETAAGAKRRRVAVLLRKECFRTGNRGGQRYDRTVPTRPYRTFHSFRAGENTAITDSKSFASSSGGC